MKPRVLTHLRSKSRTAATSFADQMARKKPTFGRIFSLCSLPRPRLQQRMIVKRVTTPLEETVKAEHLASVEKNRVMKICAKKKNEHMNPPLGRADSQKKRDVKSES